ncbi:MAG: hypothetical protein IPK17_17495 [Chloroflexi bacterium]|uniref:hypothetical protein n=1 Tax=Candidatus Flexifilum breve TaxID=3140694 RepID=UPI0031362B4B|nr:hypothetical protein [Chloroflexota bacterium]
MIAAVFPTYAPEHGIEMPENLVQQMSEALETLTARLPGSRASLYLSDAYKYDENRRRAKKFALYASAGFSPDEDDPFVKQRLKAAQAVLDEQEPRIDVRYTENAADRYALWVLHSPNDSTRVWGVLALDYAHAPLSAAVARYVQDNWLPVVAAVIQARITEAARLTNLMIKLLYNHGSIMRVVALNKTEGAKPGAARSLTKELKEIMSGAMLNNIIARAKRFAVKQECQSAGIAARLHGQRPVRNQRRVER